MRWTRDAWLVKEGTILTTYKTSRFLRTGSGCPLVITSRLERITLNGKPIWDLTGFFVLDENGVELAKEQNLKDAKKAAAKIWRERRKTT